MTSEQYARGLQFAANLGAIDATVTDVILGDKHRLSWRANRCAGAQGTWPLTNIEGAVPEPLRGVLYRIAPGQKVNHGVELMDFFDGDAFVSAYTFDEHGVTLRAGFVQTPERRREIAAKRMLYNEFGTLAPRNRHWWRIGTHWKNPPSVNVIRWNNRLLGLSEGGHPTAIGLDDLAYQSPWDFHGTLPANCAFTAHPKFDPVTGDGYAYGYTKCPWPTLYVFRMERETGRLRQLHALRQKAYFMVHDMVLTEKHLVLVIPPVKLDLIRCVFLPETLADNLRYFDNEPTRILVLDREPGGQVREFELGANMVFHHGNAHENNGRLVFDSLMYPDGRILDLVRCWSQEPPPDAAATRLTRIELDLDSGRSTTTVIGEGLELPRFALQRVGQPTRYLYATRSNTETPGDPYGAEVVKIADDARSVDTCGPASVAEVFGEPVFVPNRETVAEDDGWLLTLGYCGERDRTFLDIIDAQSMQRQARIWTDTHLPLGFHGNFYFAE